MAFDDELALLGYRRGQERRERGKHSGQAEVEHLDEIVFGAEHARKYIARLDIAMHEPAIVRLGEKSMRYEFTVRSGSSVAASGSMVVAFAAPDSPHAAPWPEDVRAALGGG